MKGGGSGSEATSRFSEVRFISFRTMSIICLKACALRNESKGISPLLATVLLVAITVVTTTMLSGWVSSTMSTTENTIANRTSEGVACAAAEIVIDDVYSGAGSNSSAYAIVRNSGGTDNLAITSAQLYDKFGNNFTTTNSLPTNLNRGQMATLTFKNMVLPGTTNDSSHGINNGTLTNGALFKLGGKYSSGMGFDGNNDTIVVPTSTSLNVTGNITIIAWFKANSIPTGDVELVNKGAYALYLSNGEVAGSVNLNNNNTIWNYTLDLGGGYDNAYGVAIDKNNNVIVAVIDSSTGVNDRQWRLMKFDTNGNSLWNFTYNPTSGNDEIYGVAVDNDNSILISGVDSSGSNQWVIMKFDTNGNHFWNITTNPSSGSDRAYSVAVDNNNSFVVVGTEYVGAGGGSDTKWRVMKFDTNGNNLWNYTSDMSSQYDLANVVAVDSNNSIVVGGWDALTGSTSDNQWRVMKFDTNGNSIWNYTENISVGLDRIYGLALDNNDNVYVNGIDNAPGNLQWHIIKLDSNGNHVWNISTNPSSLTDVMYALAVDSNSNLLSGGYENIGGGSDTALRIVKLDSNGNQKWNYTVNMSIQDIIYAIAVDKNDNFIATGYDLISTSPVYDYRAVIIKLGNLANGTTTLSAGTWYHGAFVYNGTHINVYRDGILEGSNGATGSIQGSFWNLSLGAKGGVSYRYGTNFPIGIGNNFNGTIDDIAIWNRSLTNDEINTSRNQGPLIVSNTNDLVAYWKFDEGRGMTTCPDDFSRVVVTTNCGGVSAEFSKKPKC